MLNLDGLKKRRDLINDIDWEMTPEEAVRLYLEWGNNWAGGNYVIRSREDVSHYFVINTWRERPIIYLVRRDSEQAEELAVIEMPETLEKKFLKSVGHNRGVYAIDADVKKWLQKELH
ncbi:MAG: hypothetical protein B5M56_03820 [Desulfococcus sp. 4484_241]|nr:MAG: hypothetical protein B5M56_03820 [Desulfococcus sp. 4484_241]